MYWLVALMALSAGIAKKRNYPKGEGFDLALLLKSFKEAFLPLLTPVIIIGGIWTGVFTPTFSKP